jgi:hypothetical protein
MAIKGLGIRPPSRSSVFRANRSLERFGSSGGGRGKVSVELIGDKELQKQIKNMGEKAGKRVMKSAIGAGLTILRKEAKAKAPSESIGKLIAKKAWITRRGKVNGHIYIKEDGSRTIMLDGRQVDFSAVASILEFGSMSRGIRARRFMRNARESAGDRAVQKVIQQANKAIEREWNKGRALS